MKRILIFLIETYQRYASPDHSNGGKELNPHGFCKYYPSCSEYSKQSLQKYGLIKGILKSIWRILRCNPLSKGGVDMP